MNEIKKKKISIISPVYNAAAFLPSFIANLLEYTFQDFEMIFVDNNSSDNSLQVLHELLPKTNLDYKILTESNQGSGYARNTGLKSAIGEYVIFIDSDDHIEKKKLAEDVKLIEKYDVDYVLCRTERKYTDGRTMLQPLEGLDEGIILPPKAGLIWLKNLFYLQGPGAVLAKREIIEYLGGFHTSKTGQDAFLFIKLGLFAKGYYYNKVYNFYLRHPESTISNRNKEKNGALLSYFNLWKNLYNDQLVCSNKTVMIILENNINSSIFKLHFYGHSIKELFDDSRLKEFKLNFLLFNKISLMLNKSLSNINYNPFYFIWRKQKSKYHI
jgi:glycosyltransferase involved in cell wall biosynthesis